MPSSSSNNTITDDGKGPLNTRGGSGIGIRNQEFGNRHSHSGAEDQGIGTRTVGAEDQGIGARRETKTLRKEERRVGESPPLYTQSLLLTLPHAVGQSYLPYPLTPLTPNTIGNSSGVVG